MLGAFITACNSVFAFFSSYTISNNIQGAFDIFLKQENMQSSDLKTGLSMFNNAVMPPMATGNNDKPNKEAPVWKESSTKSPHSTPTASSSPNVKPVGSNR